MKLLFSLTFQLISLSSSIFKPWMSNFKLCWAYCIVLFHSANDSESDMSSSISKNNASFRFFVEESPISPAPGATAVFTALFRPRFFLQPVALLTEGLAAPGPLALAGHLSYLCFCKVSLSLRIAAQLGHRSFPFFSA